MESAAFCASKVKSVMVLGKASVPFENILGKEIGERIAKLFTSKGVNLQMSSNIEKFVGENGKLTQVIANGVAIPADLCIVGLGSQYDTKFLQESGISLTENGAVEVDEVLYLNWTLIFECDLLFPRRAV